MIQLIKKIEQKRPKSNRENITYIKLEYLLLFLFCCLTRSGFSQTYLLDVGEEQYLSVPDAPIGYVDHTIWACDNPNIIFVQKDNIGATIKVLSFFDQAATIELLYVVKYYTNDGKTRQLTNIKNYIVQCKGTEATLIPTVLKLKVGETYQLQVSPSSYQPQTAWSLWTYQGHYITVDDKGLVTAQHEGMDFVFATIPYSSTPLVCTVYVKETKLSLQANKGSGTIDKDSYITLKASQPTAKIYFTLDGTSPIEGGQLYTGPVLIDKDLTLKAIAYDENYEPSDIIEETYNISYSVKSSIPSGIIGEGCMIELNTNLSDGTIYYTTDGAEPTNNSEIYTAPLLLTSSMIIKAFSSNEAGEQTKPVTYDYVVVPVTSLVLPDSISMLLGEKRQIEPTTLPENAKPVLRWISDNEKVARVNDKGEVRAVGRGKTKIHVMDYENKHVDDCIVNVHYQEIELTGFPSSGDVLYGSYAVLNTNPFGTSIYYTLDGTEPTTNSMLYEAPIYIDRDMTLKAFAFKDNFERSDCLTCVYTVKGVSPTVSEGVLVLEDINGNKIEFDMTNVESIDVDYSDTIPPSVKVEKVSSSGCNLKLRYTISDDIDYYYARMGKTLPASNSKISGSKEITYSWLKPDTEYFITTRAYGKNGRQGEDITTSFFTSPAPYSNYACYRNQFYALKSAERSSNNGMSFLKIYINNSEFVQFSSTNSSSWSNGTYSISSGSRYSGGIKLSSNRNLIWGDGTMKISGSGSNRIIEFCIDTGGEVEIFGYYKGTIK